MNINIKNNILKRILGQEQENIQKKSFVLNLNVHEIPKEIYDFPIKKLNFEIENIPSDLQSIIKKNQLGKQISPGQQNYILEDFSSNNQFCNDQSLRPVQSNTNQRNTKKNNVCKSTTQHLMQRYLNMSNQHQTKKCNIQTTQMQQQKEMVKNRIQMENELSMKCKRLCKEGRFMFIDLNEESDNILKGVDSTLLTRSTYLNCELDNLTKSKQTQQTNIYLQKDIEQLQMQQDQKKKLICKLKQGRKNQSRFDTLLDRSCHEFSQGQKDLEALKNIYEDNFQQIKEDNNNNNNISLEELLIQKQNDPNTDEFIQLYQQNAQKQDQSSTIIFQNNNQNVEKNIQNLKQPLQYQQKQNQSFNGHNNKIQKKDQVDLAYEASSFINQMHNHIKSRPQSRYGKGRILAQQNLYKSIQNQPHCNQVPLKRQLTMQNQNHKQEEPDVCRLKQSLYQRNSRSNTKFEGNCTSNNQDNKNQSKLFNSNELKNVAKSYSLKHQSTVTLNEQEPPNKQKKMVFYHNKKYDQMIQQYRKKILNQSSSWNAKDMSTIQQQINSSIEQPSSPQKQPLMLNSFMHRKVQEFIKKDLTNE